MTGGPMPYVMDTGPYFSVLETRLNDYAKRPATLTNLRTRVALSSIAGLDSRSLDADGKRPADRVKILNECWFGMKLVSGAWAKQPAVFPTGFWEGYQGDPEAILRAGLIRAMEIARGIDPGVDPTQRTRDWPIEVSWVCQGPFFQTWVTWMQAPGGGGHVSLTISTPAAKGLPVEAKITRAVVKPEYALEPGNNAFAAARGMWVLGHENYKKRVTYSTKGSLLGIIFEPHVEWRPTDPKMGVVCVAPAEWEGGVLAAGRPYTP